MAHESAHVSKSPDEIQEMQEALNKLSRRRVALKEVDMKDEMVQDAVNTLNKIMNDTDLEKNIADGVKKHFDVSHNGPWQCIVGRKYGSRVTHESGHFLYMHLGNQAVMLFKARSPGPGQS